MKTTFQIKMLKEPLIEKILKKADFFITFFFIAEIWA